MSHVAGRVPPIFVAVELDDYLDVSLRIVESHGGTLTARPRDGGGTVLTMTLPLREAVGSGA